MALENTHYGPTRIGEMLRSCGSLFFIGIGGVSMASLAQISLCNGFTVGGSDRAPGALVSRLEQAGVTVYTEHRAEHIQGYDAVVYTGAIAEDNPEYREAISRGIPVISRADYLGYLMMRYRQRIGIAGMHGKSTATAMCAHVLMKTADPTVLCGAELCGLSGTTYRIGEAKDHFVFEACEYMDSFLDFSPTLAVVLNIDLDHVDYFRDISQVRRSFLKYAQRTGEGGAVLYNADDAECALAMASFTGKKITVGRSEHADYRATDIALTSAGATFDLLFRGERLCRVSVPVHGMHSVYNALAAVSAAIISGIAPEAAASSLADFCGAGRRMEYRGRLNGAAVYDDYGHHPAEIRATLSAARSMGFDRILCAFQPHTYSRTAGLLDDFSKAFADADLVFLSDIYAAREQNIYGVSSDLLAGRIGEKACSCHGFSALAKEISNRARVGDLVVIMGAGDIYKTFEYLDLK